MDLWTSERAIIHEKGEEDVTLIGREVNAPEITEPSRISAECVLT